MDTEPFVLPPAHTKFAGTKEKPPPPPQLLNNNTMQTTFGFESGGGGSGETETETETRTQTEVKDDTETGASSAAGESKTQDGEELCVGDIVIFTYLTGRPKPQVGYVTAREESKLPKSYTGYVSMSDRARVKIVPLGKFGCGRWGKVGKIVTRVESECFRIPDHLSDMKII